MIAETYSDRPGATRRRYTRDKDGRVVYEALHELRDADDHVIAVGELFTVTATAARCLDCRSVRL